jgi:hypothetical protein
MQSANLCRFWRCEHKIILYALYRGSYYTDQSELVLTYIGPSVYIIIHYYVDCQHRVINSLGDPVLKTHLRTEYGVWRKSNLKPLTYPLICWHTLCLWPEVQSTRIYVSPKSPKAEGLEAPLSVSRNNELKSRCRVVFVCNMVWYNWGVLRYGVCNLYCDFILWSPTEKIKKSGVYKWTRIYDSIRSPMLQFISVFW